MGFGVVGEDGDCEEEEVIWQGLCLGEDVERGNE